MSLKALCAHYNVNPGKYLGQPPLKADVSLVFGIQSNYIPYLKTTCFSMVQVGELLEQPIVIITDDATVPEDPFVQAVADTIHVIDPALTEKLAGIKELTRPHKKKRAEVEEAGDWATGTLLKWAAFQDFGTEMNLFLDADMIFLGSIAGLVARASHADMIATVQYPNRLNKNEEGERRPKAEVYANVRAVMDYGRTELAFSINSGVMLLNKRLLNGSFLDAVIEHSVNRKKKRLANEQSHLTQYFTDRKEYTVHFAPGIYNFHEEFLNSQTVARQLSMLNDISILHYAGAIKPWNSPLRPANRFAQMVWHRINHEMEQSLKPVEAA